jgi:RNA polymerase-interacting CarD/CdnL/TRCF family regulator
MAMVEAPSNFPSFPVEQDDVVYPCKGCGEVDEIPDVSRLHEQELMFADS